MRNLPKLILSSILLVTLLASCEKENIKVDNQSNQVAFDFVQTDQEVLDLFTASEKLDARCANATAEPYGPDLIVTRIITSIPLGTTPCGPQYKGDAVCATNYSFAIEVRNIGSASTTNGFDAALYFSGANGGTGGLISNFVPTLLAPGQSIVVNYGNSPICASPLPSKEFFLGFADLNNNVAETNESNNRSRDFKVCIQ